jgi:small conductance mechanosensitive channel
MNILLAAIDTNSVAATAGKAFYRNREQIAYWIEKYGGNVLSAVGILIAGLIIGKWLGSMTMRKLMKREMEPPIRMLIVRCVRLLILVLTLLLIAENLDIKLLPLIAGLGVAGVGVGLAMQGVLSNLVAGLTIIFVKKFRVGEYIEINDVEGQVDTIELFSTTLVHPDLSRVIVPNRKIVGEIIHNYGKIRQLGLSVGVAYDTDVSRALEIVRDIVMRNPRVLKDPAPLIGTSTLADSSVVIAIKPWTALPDFGPAAAEINKALLEGFREAKINIPYPQREIRLLPGSEVKTAA